MDKRSQPSLNSRPRRRRRKAESLTVRMDLDGAKPPIWRRVELSSTLMLSGVHDLIQVIFGWEDSHLHRFTTGPSVWDQDSEMYVSEGDLAEGLDDNDVSDADVRLDEVLSEAGEVLRYVYDYGDNLALTIKLEKVSAGAPARPRVLAGRWQAPLDDSGGIWGQDAEEAQLEPIAIAELDGEVALWFEA